MPDSPTHHHLIPADTKRAQGAALLCLAAIFWSIGGLFVKLLSLGPFAIAGYRGLIAAGFLFFVLKRPALPRRKGQIGAIICYSLTTTAFVFALTKTTAANSVFLLYLAPLYIAPLSHKLVGEKISGRDWCSLVTCLVGMSCFFVSDLQPGTTLGNTVALLSGMTFAGYILCSRTQKDYSTLEIFFYGNLLTAILCLPAMLRASLSGTDIVFLAILGVLQTGVPSVMEAWAIRQVSALGIVLISILDPVLTPTWVYFFIGEKPDMLSLVGAGIIIVSLIFQARQ